MDRRDSLKALTVGTLTAGTIITGACNTKEEEKTGTGIQENDENKYGRTPEEKEYDEKLKAEKFFTEDEMAAITLLTNIIIPKDDRSGSASDAGVPAFIEFIVKDQPDYKTPVRGGLRWLNIESQKRFNATFAKANDKQRIELVDMIAYPKKAAPEMAPGVSFFNTMRNLTATGFFTSKIGIQDLDYKGNTPNEWDGVPDEVLKQYGLAYDAKTLEQCIKKEDRGKIMTWDS